MRRQIITFSNESHHFEKARISTRDLNDTFLLRESKFDPSKRGPTRNEGAVGALLVEPNGFHKKKAHAIAATG